MIDVQDVIKDVPHFTRFPSSAELTGLVEGLSGDNRFDVRVAGTSANGVPIHVVRLGNGSVKALFVGFPHCKEPVSGLTVASLIRLLSQGNRALCDTDVE